MKRYKKLFENREKIIKYSEMTDTLLISKGLTQIRSTKIPQKGENYKKDINKIRYDLAKKQHEKIGTTESFKELKKCEIMMFK